MMHKYQHMIPWMFYYLDIHAVLIEAKFKECFPLFRNSFGFYSGNNYNPKEKKIKTDSKLCIRCRILYYKIVYCFSDVISFSMILF